jgi:hypothetical protein
MKILLGILATTAMLAPLAKLKDEDKVVDEKGLIALTNTIPIIVSNIVSDIQGTVYDTELNITWKQTMYDGNLYYIAVTNANVTEVK